MISGLATSSQSSSSYSPFQESAPEEIETVGGGQTETLGLSFEAIEFPDLSVDGNESNKVKPGVCFVISRPLFRCFGPLLRCFILQLKIDVENVHLASKGVSDLLVNLV